jgi:hypothetical protein
MKQAKVPYTIFSIVSLITILSITLNPNQSVYSIQEINYNMVSNTSSGSLDVKISSLPVTIFSHNETKFKITFFEPNSTTVQVHVDYDFIILSNDKEVFSASKQTAQPLLHTAEGVVTIPYNFASPGFYNIKIPVLGINFVPLNPELAEFEVQVK